MVTLKKEERLFPRITGRMSDGSDRQITMVTEWLVEVENETIRYRAVFTQELEPTEQEIHDAFTAGMFSEVDDINTLRKEIAELRTVIDTMLGGEPDGQTPTS
jgi:hypothetical protein